MISKNLFFLTLLFPAAFAAPIGDSSNNEGLVKRAGGSRNDPVHATFDITGWEDIAEENCYAMLCIRNGDRVYQRVATETASDLNYRQSGAAFHPFYESQLGSRHTEQINADTTSAEEFPWKSTQQGGENGYVFPATIEQQRVQGAAIGHGYAGVVNFNEWFSITFTGAGMGDYCRALFSNPPDTSICKKKDHKQALFGTPNVNISNRAYQVVKTGKTPYAFKHVSGDYDGKITKRGETSETPEEAGSEKTGPSEDSVTKQGATL
ncbi:uncharacterized protein N7498_008739 [Penicillium cinerascens]|uniref:Uncharacterized protein n=1 Tax=Penicillium cinerascens TaxID=70096 RepID=A0A9W9JJA7_9EURO|nr:uncharacterized protein N7498_008739 [Penicillium cinerascens]KAJ5195301.1 hypothetical protein N7498_008739 [Penicillium cinerascens]